MERNESIDASDKNDETKETGGSPDAPSPEKLSEEDALSVPIQPAEPELPIMTLPTTTLPKSMPGGKLVSIEPGPEDQAAEAPRKILKRQDSVAVPWGMMVQGGQLLPGAIRRPMGPVMLQPEEAALLRKRPGLRALAQAREISSLWFKKVRSRSIARSVISSIPQAALMLGEVPSSSEPDLTTELIISEQRKEFLCCLFLFCCGILACKFLIIDQYKANRKREDATTTAPFTIEPFRKIADPDLKQEPVPTFPVICVYGETLAPSTPMPHDGICDFLYYDSFFKGGKNRIGPRAVPTASINTFFKLAKRGAYVSTQMGIGFSQYGASEATHILTTDEGDNYMLSLWKEKKIRHYGILDVDPRTANVGDLYSLLGALRSHQLWNIENMQTMPKPTAYLILGVTFTIPRDGPAYAALEALFTKFPVDALIARTHLAERDDGRVDCRITGPTVYKSPASSYQLALVDVVKFLHEKRHSFGRPAVTVSFTMQARWYHPRDTSSHAYVQWWPPSYIYPYPGYKPGQRCTNLGAKEPFTTPFHLCSGDRAYQKRLEQVKEGQQVMFTFSEREGLSLLYDSQYTIRKKYCDLRQILNGVAYGIAIFDGDYDVLENNPCGEERNWLRMTLARKLVDYVKQTENQHYPNDCWTLT